MDYLEEYVAQLVIENPSSKLNEEIKHISNETYVNSVESKINPKQRNGFRSGLSLCKSDTYGRYLVSSCVFEAGDVVMVEKPCVMAPTVGTPWSQSDPPCLGCFKVTCSGYYCPNCGYYFCDNKCLRDSHTEECKILSRLNLIQGHLDAEIMRKKMKSLENESTSEENSLISQNLAKQNILSPCFVHRDRIINYYPCIAVLRTLMYLNKNPSAKSILLSLQENSYETGRRHATNQRLVVDVIQNDLQYCEDPEFLHKIAGIWDTNAYEVQLTSEIKAKGLYIGASLFNHSCKPNLEQWFTSSGDMVMRALEDIPSKSFLSVCYTETLWPTRMRIDHLLLTKQFSCNCERCSDNTEFETFIGSVRCPECNSFLLSSCSLNPSAKLNCPRECQITLTSKQLVWKDIACTKRFGGVNVANLKEVDERLREAENEFHPSYHLLLRLRLAVVDAHKSTNLQDLSEEEFKVLEDASQVSHGTIRRLCPRFSRRRARVTGAYLRSRLERIRRNEIAGFCFERTSPEPKETNSTEYLKELIEETHIVSGWDSRMPSMIPIEHDFESFVVNKGRTRS